MKETARWAAQPDCRNRPNPGAPVQQLDTGQQVGLCSPERSPRSDGLTQQVPWGTCGHPNAIGPYRLLLEQFGAESANPIQRVVMFGRPTLSREINTLMANTGLERALYLPTPVTWFESGRRPELILTQWDQLIGFAGCGPEGWLEAWQDASAHAEDVLDAVLAEAPEPGTLAGQLVARKLWERAQQDPGSNLVLGSSNPVRDVDLAGKPTEESNARIFANRGLAGIDGTVATATGVALATHKPTRVLVGDLTVCECNGLA